MTTTTETGTTPATYLSVAIEGIRDKGLVYWSEETGKFDLSALSVSLKVVEAGEVVKTIDVTNAFTPDAESPEDIDFPARTGCKASAINFILTDEAAVQKAVTDAGYDAALLAEGGIVEGKAAGRVIVTLVLRGDADLDGTVSLDDAIATLQYYSHTLLAHRSAKESLESGSLNKGMDETMFPYVHYAADAFDGDGTITLDDAMSILQYYTELTLKRHADTTWTADINNGKQVTPKDELHADPFAFDAAINGDYSFN